MGYSKKALQAKIEGKCIDCRENPAREGKLTCVVCAADRAAYCKARYLTSGGRVLAYVKAWKLAHPEQANASTKRYRARLKAKVFAMLGNRCAWEGCGWTDPRALQIDHKFGDGIKDRADGLVGTSFLKKVLKDNGNRYQLLCANHNWIKRVEQGEINPFPKSEK